MNVRRIINTRTALSDIKQTWSILIFAVYVLASCTGLKNISSNDPLFVNHKLNYLDRNTEIRQALPDLTNALLPKPNTKFLWMRPALARFNMISDSARNKKFWKNKISEPVKISQVKPELVSRVISNRLFHGGFLNTSVDFEAIPVGKKQSKFVYSIKLGKPHRIGQIIFPDPIDSLHAKISDSKTNSILTSGDIYKLSILKDERTRINKFLEENGYIYFNPEFIIFKADSSSRNQIINLRLEVKPDTPPESRKPYSIGKITIFDDHSLNETEIDTLDFNPIFLISGNNNLKIDALEKGLFINPGELYSRNNHIQTIRYYSNLPIIRYASLKFTDIGNDTLDASVYLSQRKRYAYTAEFNTIFRSTNYFGPGIIFSYTDRNVRRAANRLKIDLRARYEVQVSEGVINPAYEVGVVFNYTLPKIYPTFLKNLGRRSLPRTNISAGYNLFNRLDLYRLNSIFSDVGYRWSKNNKLSHTFNPLEIVFTSIPEDSKSNEFREYLNENPGVNRSFEEQFVLGLSYGFTYDPASSGKSQFYLRGGIDLAGNLLDLMYNATGATPDSSGRYRFFGIPFSQYVRLMTDFRYSYRLNKGSSLATRFVAGFGIPYGNSNILPYIRQFYVGGTNSLRSFIARSVGPGAEVPPQGFNDLTGDIRLEWNLEYRFSIASRFKGALFTDAGNVWLYNEDASRPDGNFKLNTFIDQVALSAGWGLRWDFDFVVARLDFAYTLRTPYLLEGDKWTKNLNILKPVLNIAIGYPF